MTRPHIVRRLDDCSVAAREFGYRHGPEQTVTFELSDGKRLALDARDIREHGLKACAARYGIDVGDERVSVLQHGRKVGTVPGDFDPLTIKSTSWLYDPRPGDFTRGVDGWLAANNLGPGDLEAVPGFVWAEGESWR